MGTRESGWRSAIRSLRVSATVLSCGACFSATRSRRVTSYSIQNAVRSRPECLVSAKYISFPYLDSCVRFSDKSPRAENTFTSW